MRSKFIFGLAAASVLLATSCSQQELDAPVAATGSEATLTLAVNTPHGINSRVYGDGTTVDQLRYGLYKKVDDTYTLVDSVYVGDFTGSYNLQLKLPTGFSYKLVFWADNSEIKTGDQSPYILKLGESEATMTLEGTSGSISANDERADAFFAFYDFAVNGDLSGTIELKRPFAQINVGTNDLADYKKETGYDNIRTSFRVKDVKAANQLNLMDGEVSGEAQSVFFNENLIPKTEKFPVPGYEYLTMGYFLVGDEQELVTVELNYHQYETPRETRTVKNVPVRRNYRTNIYGQVLTSNIDLNVIVAPAFDGALEPNILEVIAGVGGTATLDADIALATGETITFVKDAIIELGDYNITGDTDGLITAANGATVQIKGGNGGVNSGDAIAMVADGGTVVIEGGNYTTTGETLVKAGDTNPGTVYIKGGTFTAAGDEALQCADDESTIVITGGQFVGFSPESFVAPGYKCEEVGNTYYVVPAESIVLESDDNNALINALSAFATSNEPEATIILKDGSFKMKEGSSATFTWPQDKKITFIGAGKDKTTIENADAASTPGCEIVLSNLSYTIFENPTNHTSFGFKGATKVDISDCTIKGEFHAYTGDVTITNSTFLFGGGPGNTTNYALWISTAGKTVVDGCTFDVSSKENATKESKGILVYSEPALGNTEMGDIDITNSKFIVTGAKSTKSAIEIHSELFTKAGVLNISNIEWNEEDFLSLWREINNTTSTPTNFFTVILDGEKVQN